MFRPIAIALTLTFTLLALIGTSGDQGVSGSEMVAAAGFPRGGPDETTGAALQYVTRPHQALKAAPDNASGILHILPYGAPLLPMGVTEGDFVKVRDRSGRVGFVRGDVLSAVFPD